MDHPLYPPMVGTGSVLAWSGFGQFQKGTKVSKSEWPKWVLHMKPNRRPRSQFRNRKNCVILIRPE